MPMLMIRFYRAAHKHVRAIAMTQDRLTELKTVAGIIFAKVPFGLACWRYLFLFGCGLP